MKRARADRAAPDELERALEILGSDAQSTGVRVGPAHFGVRLVEGATVSFERLLELRGVVADVGLEPVEGRLLVVGYTDLESLAYKSVRGRTRINRANQAVPAVPDQRVKAVVDAVAGAFFLFGEIRVEGGEVRAVVVRPFLSDVLDFRARPVLDYVQSAHFELSEGAVVLRVRAAD